MYAASVVSSVYSSRFNLRKSLNANGAGHSGDELDPSPQSSLENAIFGVLYTLSKENSETRILIRWVVLKVLLDGWQVFTTVIEPGQGWDIRPDGPAWRAVSVLSFRWLADLGYGAYVALLYGMVALLAANIGLCVWVAWCFKEQKFPVIWPVKVLRLFSSVFFQAFDVASLNLLQVGMSCRLTGPAQPHLHLSLFPSHSCTAMPQLVHAIVSAVSLLVFIALALLTNMAEVEVNLKARRPMALGHSGAEVAAFAIKVLMTFVDLFFGWRRPAAVCYLVLSLLLAWQYLRWSPHLVDWVNHLKTGVSTSTVWAAIWLVVLAFVPRTDAWARGTTVAMLTGLIPAVGVGAAVSWYIARRRVAAADRALQEAAAENAPLEDFCAHLFADPRDVEIISRCCRVWVAHKSLDKDAVARAQTFLKAGLALYPGDAFVSLVQANFMIDVLGVGQTGSRHVEAASKLHPGLMCRFMIFVRQQQAQQKAAGSSVSGGAGSNMDLLGYVEYQRKQRMVVRLHREALQAMCSFWKALDTTGAVSFTSLSKALTNIENSVSQAQAAYHLVLETYGNNPRLVRLYGRFLETIKNDPWGAGEYYAEAERLEQAKSDDSNGPLLPDGTPLSRMDEISTAVLVISSSGEIQMANKQVHHLFGYRKGDLDGKMMAALLAPQSGRRLAAVLEGLVESSLTAPDAAAAAPTVAMAVAEGQDGAGAAPASSSGATAAVLGMHRERMAFPLRISLNKASGVGEDSTFIAVLEPVKPPRNTVTFWVAPNGVIAACDPHFVAHFGFTPSDVVGAQLGSFLVCNGPNGARGSSTGGEDCDLRSSISGGDWDVEASGGANGSVLGGAGGPGSEPSMLDRLLAQQSEAAAGARAAVPCLVPHRYTTPVACVATARALDLGDAALYEVRFKPSGPEPLLLMVSDRKGAIRFASPHLATTLCPRASAWTDPAAAGAAAGGPGAIVPAAAVIAEGGLVGKSYTHPGLLGSVGASLHELLLRYSLQDFLPPMWREMHVKLLKDVNTSATATPSSAAPARGHWSPAAPRQQGGRGPSLELRTAAGQPLFMHVSVGASEAEGEPLHVVHLASSSLEAALCERRLRLGVSEDGRITEISKDTPCSQLFGFDANQLTGRLLWELVEGLEEELLLPLAMPEREGPRRTGSTVPSAALLEALTDRVDRASPGTSWRVNLTIPAHTRNAKAGLNGKQGSAAQRSGRTRPAVMSITIADASSANPEASAAGEDGANGAAGAPAPPALLVDLWPLQAVSGVLQLDGEGRIKAVLEERLRPAGLLFGIPTGELAGESLEALVSLPPGCAELGELLLPGGRSKKSSLKQDKDPEVKIGPVHVLGGVHADGRPLQVELQLVGRPGPDQPLTALLRMHAAPLVPARGSPRAAPDCQPSTLALPPAAEGDLAATGAANFEALSSSPVAIPERPSAASEDDLAAAVLALDSELRTGGAKKPNSPELATPGTPHKSLPELLVAADPSVSGPSGSGGGRLSPSQAAAPALPSALSTAIDLPLPGVVAQQMQGQRADVSVRRSSVADPAAVACSIVLRSPARGAADMHDSVTEASHGKDRMRLSGGGIRIPADLESDDEPAAVQAASPRSMKRVSDWVQSKGALYQNATPKISACGYTDRDDLPMRCDSRGLSDLPIRDPRLAARAFDSRAATAATGVALTHVGSTLMSRAPTLDPGLRAERDAGGAGRPRSPAAAAPAAQAVSRAISGDIDDAASEGGRSGMSGVSGSSAGAEYKRGKRFRNLVKLMDSGHADHVLNRFRRGALLSMLLLAVAHVVCFALVVTSIKGQQKSMLQLVIAGRSQRMLHQVLVAVRALDQIYKNKAPPNLYTTADIPELADRIYTSAFGVKSLNNEVAASNRDEALIQDLYYFTAMRAWASNNVTTGEDIYTNITLWDMATRVYTYSKEIYQNHEEWAAKGINISSTASGQFLLKSASDLFNGYRKVLDALLYIAVENTKHVNNLQLACLVAEGCGVSVLAAALLAFLLKRLAAQRHTLYGTFLAIPVGLTRAIATQITNTPLLDEEEDDDDEDGLGDETEGAGKAAAQDVARAGSGLPRDREKDRDRDKDKDREKEREKRHATLNPLQPDNPSSRGPSRGTSFKKGHSESGAQQAAAPARGWARVSHFFRSRGWLRRLCCCLKFRSQAVLPWPGADGSHSGGAHSSLANLVPFGGHVGSVSLGGSAARRYLRTDSHDTAKLLTPFVLWSCLVVAFYAVSVVELQDVQPLVAVASVSNFNTARTYRTCFFAQELAAEEDPAKLPTRRAALKRAATLLRDAFYTLQLGQDAYKAMGNDTERFPMVTVGLSYETAAMQKLMYTNTGCLRLPTSPPCPGPGYRFYELIRSGQDSIMQSYLSNAFAMADEVTGVTPGLANPRFDLIFNIGTRDLTDANIQIGLLHFDYLKGLFNGILLLHIILFVLLWVCLAAFMWLLLNPLVARFIKEKRRIAELLSQLPLELDVEKLVRAALTGGGAAAGHGKDAGGASADAAPQAAGPAGGQDGPQSDTVKAWKSVLRSASTVVAAAKESSIRSGTGMRQRRSSALLPV